jgi:hypothetical protein
MYFPRSFPRTVSWLLAAALAVQPMAGFSCGCSVGRADSVAQPVKPRCGCCCGGLAGRCCCCASGPRHASDNRPARTCCQHSRSHESAPAGDRVCHCSSRSPSPPTVPAERNHSDDLAASACYAYTVVVDASADHGASWAANRPTEFASASEHCVALCRLRF